jgi:hypothetical protein
MGQPEVKELEDEAENREGPARVDVRPLVEDLSRSELPKVL